MPDAADREAADKTLTRPKHIGLALFAAAVALAVVTAASAQAPPLDDPPPEATMVIPEIVIHNVVRNDVTQRLADRGDLDEAVRTEIDVRWQGDVLLRHAGVVDYRVRKLSRRPFRGPTVTRVDILVDGQHQRTLTVTVDCRLFRDVVVTSRTVRRGESLLGADAVEIQERDITNLKHGYYTDLGALEMMQASRSIGAGGIVTHRHAEPVPVIHRGDQVVMRMRSAHMVLEATGVAMQDGGIGEEIRVRNDDSGKVVRGEILDADTVRILGL